MILLKLVKSIGIYKLLIMKKCMKCGGAHKYAKGGFPDLTGDGKVTRADILKGRGVFGKGGSYYAECGGSVSKVIKGSSLRSNG